MNTLLGLFHFYFRLNSITGHVLISYLYRFCRITCSSIPKDEIAGARPDILNIFDYSIF